MSVEYIYPAQYRFDAPNVYTPSHSGGGGDLSFKDVLDTVNPLQQLPVVGSLYREVSGDTIGPLARLAGGFLLGGPLGFMAAAVNAGLEMATGEDIAGHALVFLTGGEGDAPVQVAQAAAKGIFKLS